MIKEAIVKIVNKEDLTYNEVCIVAARSDDFHQLHVCCYFDGVISHRGGTPGNFVGRFGFNTMKFLKRSLN